MAKTILVTGATGQVASALLPHLANQGVSVRALVRDPAKASKLSGLEIVQGDLDAHHGLVPAFQGVDTVVIIHPPGPKAPEQSSNAVWAAKQAGARRIIRLSAIGAGYDAPTINGRLHGVSDAEVAASGLAYTIVKPHFFFQNLLGMAGSLAKDGVLYMAMGEGKLPMIDVRDIGEFLARVVLGNGHDGKSYTITGPAAYTLHDVVGAIGRATGKDAKYIPVPVEAAANAMRGYGADEWMVGMMVDYFNAYSRSWASEVTRDFETVVGHASRSADDFARDFAAAFKG